MLQNNLYHAQILVHRNGEVTRHKAGRFVVSNGSLRHLEDYYGLLGKKIPEGPVDDLTIHQINHSGPDLAVASHHDISHGHRLDFIPEHPLNGALPAQVQPGSATTTSIADQAQVVKPKPVWLYQRTGHDSAHTLEHHGQGKYSLDGNPLESDEVQTILQNLRAKSATLRYKGDGMVDTIAKFEHSFRFLILSKSDDMDPQAALAHLDGLHDGNETTASAIRALRRHMFEDPMNPGVGNKYAYEEFKKKQVPGVWSSLDLNDMKHLNDTQGHDAGDHLIRAAGAAIRAGVDPTKSKVFRAGGDEYVMHHPDPETAYESARQIREHMDKIPHIGGTYKPSFSVGMGHDFPTADKALYEAKKQKVTQTPLGPSRAFAPGAVPHLAHSLIPGHEGPVPLQSQNTVKAPPPAPEPPPALKV